MSDLMVGIIVAFIVGAIVGWKVNDALFKYTFGKMLNDAGVTDAKLAQFIKHWQPIVEQESGISPLEDKISIRIEQHHGALYAFRKDTDQFLGQAATAEELIEVLKAKAHDGQEFTCTDEDGAKHFVKS
jgi:hypothetical protein